MSTDLASLVVRLVGDSQSYTSMLGKATKDAAVFQGGILGNLSTVGQGLVGGTMAVLKTAVVGVGIAAGAAGVVMGKFLMDSVQAAADAEKAQSQLQAVLKSTGGVAGITADAANALATKLSLITPYEDEAVLSGENMLLTFTNIGKNVFPQATATILDMSTALGQDLQSSAIQLGKALQDPIQGVTALRRVGVNFSDDQQKVIKSLVESGKTEEAQVYILKELQKEFGGSAEAAGKTFAGQMAILQTQLGNVKETVGGALLPVLGNLAKTLNTELSKPETQAFITSIANALGDFATKAISYLPTALSWIKQTFGWLGTNLGPIISDVKHFISDFVGGFQAVSGQGTFVDAFLTGLANGFLGLADKIPVFQQIGDFIFKLIDIFDSFVIAVQQDKGIMVAILTTLGLALAAFAINAAVAWIAAFGPILLALAVVGLAVYGLYTLWTTNWGGIQDKTAALIAWLVTAFNNVMATIMAIWNNPLLQLTIQTILTNIKLIMGAFQAAANGDWTRFGEMLRMVWDNTWRMIGIILQNAWVSLQGLIKTLIDNIVNFFKTTDWGAVGKNIIQGIANGITSSLSWIINAAKKAAQAALDAAKGFLGIKSPSKETEMQIGMPFGQGVGVGIGKSFDVISGNMPGLFSGMMKPAFANATSGVGPSAGTSAGGVTVQLVNPSFFGTDIYEAARVLEPAVDLLLRRKGVK